MNKSCIGRHDQSPSRRFNSYFQWNIFLK